MKFNELFEGVQSNKPAKPYFKAGDWVLYDKYGFATDFRGWLRGPKYVKVIKVKKDKQWGFSYVLEAHDEVGNVVESIEKTHRELGESFRNASRTNWWDWSLDSRYEKVSKPKFKKPAPKMNIKKIEKLATKHLSWFDLDDEVALSWSTRKHGNVGWDEAGDEDIKAAETFRQAVRKSDRGARVSIEVVDEWVYVSVEQASALNEALLPRGREGGKIKAAIKRISKKYGYKIGDVTETRNMSGYVGFGSKDTENLPDISYDDTQRVKEDLRKELEAEGNKLKAELEAKLQQLKLPAVVHVGTSVIKDRGKSYAKLHVSAVYDDGVAVTPLEFL